MCVCLTFDVLVCEAVPFTVPLIVAYVPLTDGMGRVNLVMRVTDIDGEAEVAVERTTADFPDPLDVGHLSFRFRNLSFPKEGQYLFELFADGIAICHRRLRIRIQEAQQ